MNKSLLTNLVAGGAFVIAYLAPEFTGQPILFQASLFALSGALTNWLAIHMLFERVPGLYGSGVVPLHFKEFKAGIRSLILENFFTQENFSQITHDIASDTHLKDRVMEKIDLDSLYNGFVTVVKNSSFGGMLGMLGGEQALEPLRDPFKEEFSKQLEMLFEKLDLGDALNTPEEFKRLRAQVEQMVDVRLDELTPEKVKEIVQSMIQTHLGWLVVWGGVFGAFIGLISAIIL